MMPLVEIPPLVDQSAQNYQDLFSPEPCEPVKRYLSGWYVSDHQTIQAMNGWLVVQTRNQSRWNRFFTESAWSTTAVNERRWHWLRQATATRPKQPAGLIRDDTHHEKDGEPFPWLGTWFIPRADRVGLWHHLVTIHSADRPVDSPLERRW